MDNLWTPWRMTYIVENTSREGCLFCDLIDSGEEPRYILRRSRHAFLILNIYPYTIGHLMAVPYRHVDSMARLTDDERNDLMTLTAEAERALVEAYGCPRIIGGVNMGRAAGAGVVGHVHVHLVPRRERDAEQSPAVSRLTAPPEDLSVTFRRIESALEAIGAGS